MQTVSDNYIILQTEDQYDYGLYVVGASNIKFSENVFASTLDDDDYDYYYEYPTFIYDANDILSFSANYHNLAVLTIDHNILLWRGADDVIVDVPLEIPVSNYKFIKIIISGNVNRPKIYGIDTSKNLWCITINHYIRGRPKDKESKIDNLSEIKNLSAVDNVVTCGNLGDYIFVKNIVYQYDLFGNFEYFGTNIRDVKNITYYTNNIDDEGRHIENMMILYDNGSFNDTLNLFNGNADNIYEDKYLHDGKIYNFNNELFGEIPNKYIIDADKLIITNDHFVYIVGDNDVIMDVTWESGNPVYAVFYGNTTLKSANFLN